jgi:hypothetical protein
MARKVFACLLLLVAMALGAQDRSESFGVIIYAEGRDVTIQRDGTRVRYDAVYGEPLGVPLFAGDVVETDNETFVEIQLLPSRGVVKVAENTVFTIEGLTETGETALRVTYGRLRARVNALVGNQSFNVRGQTTVAGVRGTDFGFDQVFSAGDNDLVNRVYCFEGEVEVVRAASQDDTEAAPAVRIGEGEMIALGQSAAADAVIEPRRMPTAVRTFWNENDFRATEVSPSRIEDTYPGITEKVSSRLGELPAFMPAARISQPEPEQIAETTPEEVELAEIQPATEEPAVEPSEPEGEEIAPISVDEAEQPETAEYEQPAAEQEAVAEESEIVGSEGEEEAAPEIGVTAIERDQAVPDQPSPVLEPVEEEETDRGVGFSRFARITGVTLSTVGFLAEAGAISLYYFGEQLIPSYTDWGPDWLWPIALSGGGALAAGIVMIMIGLITAP